MITVCALRLAPCAVAGAVAVQGMQCGALQSCAGQGSELALVVDSLFTLRIKEVETLEVNLQVDVLALS